MLCGKSVNIGIELWWFIIVDLLYLTLIARFSHYLLDLVYTIPSVIDFLFAFFFFNHLSTNVFNWEFASSTICYLSWHIILKLCMHLKILQFNLCFYHAKMYSSVSYGIIWVHMTNFCGLYFSDSWGCNFMDYCKFSLFEN